MEIKLSNNFKLKSYVPFILKEISESDGDVTITGYASTFNNTDRYNDVMVKGCFKKSIRKNKGKWVVKLNHYEDIGVNVKAKEDDKGLYIESKLFTGPDALEDSIKAVKLIKNAMRYNHPMGLSIGGMVKDIESSYDDKTKETTYKIKEFDVLEHSITSIPANPQAEIDKIKSVFFKSNATNSFNDNAMNNDLFDFLNNFIHYL